MKYPELNEAIGDLQGRITRDGRIMVDMARENLQAKERLDKAERLLGKVFLCLKSPQKEDNLRAVKHQIEKYLQGR